MTLWEICLSFLHHPRAPYNHSQPDFTSGINHRPPLPPPLMHKVSAVQRSPIFLGPAQNYSGFSGHCQPALFSSLPQQLGGGSARRQEARSPPARNRGGRWRCENCWDTPNRRPADILAAPIVVDVGGFNPTTTFSILDWSLLDSRGLWESYTGHPFPLLLWPVAFVDQD